MSDTPKDPFALWNFIVQLLAAIGTVGAVLVAIWGDWFKSVFAAPILSLDLENAMGVLGRSADGRRAIYYHLRVRNSRRWSAARKCRVLLKEIYHRRPDQQFYALEMPVPVSFFWAPRGYTPLEIDVLHEQVLDFGSVIEKETVFTPSLTVLLASTDVQVRANEPKRFSLVLSAEGYKSSARYVLEVAWDGYWTSDLQDMSKHLVLRRILSDSA